MLMLPTGTSVYLRKRKKILGEQIRGKKDTEVLRREEASFPAFWSSISEEIVSLEQLEYSPSLSSGDRFHSKRQT